MWDYDTPDLTVWDYTSVCNDNLLIISSNIYTATFAQALVNQTNSLANVSS